MVVYAVQLREYSSSGSSRATLARAIVVLLPPEFIILKLLERPSLVVT